MTKFTYNTPFSKAQFPKATVLADKVLNVLKSNANGAFLTNTLPQIMSTQSLDSSSVTITSPLQLTTSYGLYNSTDATPNSNTYSLLVQSLNTLTSDLINSGLPNGANYPRIVFTDSVKAVGFDSVKTNTSANAFPKIYADTCINENHVGRIEFTEAEINPSGISVNERWSGTLKLMEERVVIALKNGNDVMGLLAVSVPKGTI